jgi:hypothetical protein
VGVAKEVVKGGTGWRGERLVDSLEQRSCNEREWRNTSDHI